MSSLWFGDFRCRQLKRWIKPYQAGDKLFIIEDNAELSWMNATMVSELYKNSITSNDVIILLGINDCINACTWEAISLQQIANDYCDSINELITLFNNLNFYFCSVNPVDRAYPGANVAGDLIDVNALNDAIETFNSIIKSKCNATFIDSYTYLTTTKFSTRDGVRYTQETCEALLSYLNNAVKIGYGGVFVPRLTPPAISGYQEGDGDLIVAGAYWISSETGYAGLNPYPANNKYSKFDGDTLPSSTAWAWGRFYEILGTEPKFKYGNAETWYSYTQDGYRRGDQPALGAVMCWQYGPGVSADDAITELGGHVAIVEQINDDGSIITSESRMNSSGYWWTTKRTKNGRYEQTPDNETGLTFIETGDNTWGYSKDIGYRFQGFIYCPATVFVDKSEVSGNISNYLTEEQRKKNAQYIWQYFGSIGWTMNAVAALLGNMSEESNFNPWGWEGFCPGSTIDPDTGKHSVNIDALCTFYDNLYETNLKKAQEEAIEKGEDPKLVSVTSHWPGYGLVQWTSTGCGKKYNQAGSAGGFSTYHKYINWCADNQLDYWDIDSQLARILWEIDNNVQWGLAWYNEGFTYLGKSFDNLTFKDFTTSTEDCGWLAAAFAFCYEKPGRSSGDSNTKLALCNDRASKAREWYSELSKMGAQVSGAMFQATDIKVIKATSTSAEVSFFASKLKKARYKLNNGGGYKNIEIANRLTNSAYASFIIDNLRPGDTYELTIELFSTDDRSILKTVIFTMSQSLPESFEKITLIKNDNKLPSETFQLVTLPAKPSFGYWKGVNNYGYTLQLMVNGYIKEETNLPTLPATININKLFEHKVKAGDIIQIGIRNWVKYKGKKLYDSDRAKMSNPIAMLVQPMSIFINVD